MDIEKYIASGILELYVAGILSEVENLDIARYAGEHAEIQKEIEEIEASVLALTKAAAPKGGAQINLAKVQAKIAATQAPKVIEMQPTKNNWSSYIGWAASIIFAVGLFWMYSENNSLKSDLDATTQANSALEEKIEEAKTSLDKSQELLTTIRDKDIQVVALGGQAVDPNSYAKAYWNKSEQKVFIDAQGLPEPPDGMVYQVWSLKLNPLTPTSMGLLEDFITDDNKVFALNNPNESEAFGITLEPAGGSEAPNLEQLYTLGVVSS
ncbi:anti-sigma factor [Cellulophaga sp. E16_2]|uniref:anti-sigma factor n=1 Tax=unclassified Cellulophaga TaxID=2634405 RepID=UPI0013FD334F|nr:MULTISPECIES: anti-sigma factor [unclassified Cellulophaga]MBO0589927.1 anti-sigma factor [Cellulophaga sp. E16_2]